MAGLLAAAAVWVTIRNRQRSIQFQLVRAAGLSTARFRAALGWRPAVPLVGPAVADARFNWSGH